MFNPLYMTESVLTLGGATDYAAEISGARLVPTSSSATIRLAQLALVRGLWNDAIGGEDGEIGADGFDFNPPWLAREARRMMRPPRGGNSLPTGHDPEPEVP